MSVLLFPFLHSFAQTHTLHLKVKVVQPMNGADTIFVAGNFNNWQADESRYQLKKIGAEYCVDLPGLKEKVCEFKFTRGKWDRAEAHTNGTATVQRLVKLLADTTIHCVIEDWQDNFLMPDRQHTASANVRIENTAFFMPQLQRTGKIWMYLPEGYAKPKNKTRYPVLYMFDGQNLFDEYTSGYGEWGVDECLDSLIKSGKPACIIVGIDTRPVAFNEEPHYDKTYGEQKADKYLDFLVNNLKPFIDKHYRTLKSGDNTCIAGSSLGGMMSFFALLSYPEVFKKGGVFSPSLRTLPLIKQLTDSLGDKISGKIFFYMGQLEGDTYVNDLKEISDKIGQRSDALIYTVIDPYGEHNETSWRKWFPEFYCWIMADGFNHQVNIEK